MSKRIKRLALAGGFLVAVGAILCVLALKGVRIPCLFYELTGGLLCPGCGNTRAVVALLQLDLFKALSYNPLFPLEFFYIFFVFFFCCRNYLKNGRFSYRATPCFLDYFVLAAILIWWILRNFLQRGML